MLAESHIQSGPCVIDLTLSESDDDAVVEVPNPAGREGVVSPVPSTRTGSSFGPLEIIPAERRPDGPNSASRIYHNDSQQALNSNGQARGKDSVLFQALCLVDEEVDCHRGLFDDRQLTSVRAKAYDSLMAGQNPSRIGTGCSWSPEELATGRVLIRKCIAQMVEDQATLLEHRDILRKGKMSSTVPKRASGNRCIPGPSPAAKGKGSAQERGDVTSKGPFVTGVSKIDGPKGATDSYIPRASSSLKRSADGSLKIPPKSECRSGSLPQAASSTEESVPKARLSLRKISGHMDGTLASARVSAPSLQGSSTRRTRQQMDADPPTVREPSSEQRVALLGSLGNRMQRPYQSIKERRTACHKFEALAHDSRLPLGQPGEFVHVDFSSLEIQALLPSVASVRSVKVSKECASHRRPNCLGCINNRLQQCLQGATKAEIAMIVRHVRRLLDSYRAEALRGRQEQDIKRFLKDASEGLIPQRPSSVRLKSRQSSLTPIPRRLQQELGHDQLRRGYRSRNSAVLGQKLHVYDSLKLSQTWPFGGSGDVVSVAWSPNGDVFSAGCAAHTDTHNMQYNRWRNCVLGISSRGDLHELPHHRLPRPRTELGPNSTDEMVNTLDPWLYYTVSSVNFSPDGRRLFTASYDRTVKIWDVESSGYRPDRLLLTLDHDAAVDIVAGSDHYPNIIATGAKSIRDGVRLFGIDGDGRSTTSGASFSSSRALAFPGKDIHPSCLQWGPHSTTAKFLLAGYTANVAEETGRTSREGDVCIFDVEKEALLRVTPGAQSVFDCVWHPTLPRFAVGCAADSNANRGVRSYVRLFMCNLLATAWLELECPAVDINEVTWCTDMAYCTASCTDGKTYVWDLRMPSRIMHVLKHGDSLQPLPSPDNPVWRPREATDTGVRFAEWGESTDRFYTGSSDGIVKAWNIKLAPSDALVKDLVHLDAGIMCGQLSHDHSKLLLGDSAGGLSVLSVDLGRDQLARNSSPGVSGGYRIEEDEDEEEEEEEVKQLRFLEAKSIDRSMSGVGSNAEDLETSDTLGIGVRDSVQIDVDLEV